MFEGTNKNIQEIATPSPDDIEAALALIDEDHELKNHPRVQALISTDFVTEDGRQLDPGNFLAAVKEALSREPETESTESYEARIARIMDAMVTHSNLTQLH